MNLTPRLQLQKPNGDPETGDFLDIDVLNANMDQIDGVISFTVCTSSTRPGTPFQGQGIIEADTGRAYIYVDSTWRQLVVGGARTFLNLEVERPAGSDWVLSGHVAGDAQKRLILDASGRIQWGPGGSTALDTNLYRGGADLLKTDDSLMAAGFVTGNAVESIRNTASGLITTTETVIQSVSFNAISGAKYLVQATQHFQSTVVNDLGILRLRYAAGSSVTTAGTQLTAIYPNASTANRGVPYSFGKIFTAPSTGQFTVGVTLVRDAGTGSLTSHGQAGKAENSIIITGA